MLTRTKLATVTIPERMVGLYLNAIVEDIKRNPEVIDWRQTGEGTFVILCMLGDGTFVTWFVGWYGVSEGHYTPSADVARSDFATRP